MDDEDILSEARTRYDDALSADDENRKEALNDLRFAAGEQWWEATKAEREAAGKPILTVNRIPQFMRQVVNEVRLNPPNIRVSPMDSGSDPQLAEALGGVIRGIEQASDAETAYITALESSAACGVGHFRVTTEYTTDDGWEQDIRIRPVWSPFAVVWDHGSRMQTREDARFCFVVDLLTRQEFERRYPDAVPDSWDQFAKEYPNWNEASDYVRIAEYWYKKPERRRIALMANGETINLDDQEPGVVEEGRRLGLIVRERTVTVDCVYHTLLSAASVLEKPRKWPGRYIPVVPVLGEEVFVGDRVVRRGIVRGMKDPQRLYNIYTSALAESAAMATKAKWLATPAQIAGHEAAWSVANVSNHPVLFYNSDPEAPGLPQRVAPAMPEAALIQQLGLAAADMEATSGIYRAGLGQESNERSGVALEAKQREGDVGTYAFVDNLRRAVAMCGRIVLDLMPHIYDTPRVLRVIGEDQAEKFLPINQPGGGLRMQDLSSGKYDVKAVAGPSFTTRREETRREMAAFMQSMPQQAGLVADLFAKMLDWPGAAEIAKRLRKTLPPGIADPEPGDPPPQPPPPDPNALLAMAEMRKAEVRAMEVQVEAQVKLAEIELKRGELMLEAQKVNIDATKVVDDGNYKAAKIALEMRGQSMPVMPR